MATPKDKLQSGNAILFAPLSVNDSGRQRVVDDDAASEGENPVTAEDPEIRLKAKVTTPHGLHLSPISQIVRQASGFTSKITLSFDRRLADARSVYDLMMLAAPFGADITITAVGEDAQQAVDAIKQLFNDAFVIPENTPDPQAYGGNSQT